MKSFFISQNSINNDELHLIQKIFSSYSESVLKEIDENVEVWIIGNQNSSFFNDIIGRLKNNTITNPFKNIPINISPELKHLAVIYYNRKQSEKVQDKIVYGNKEGNLYDFASCVIYRVKEMFPQKNSSYKNYLTESKLH